MRRSNPFGEIEALFERMSRQFDEVGRFDSGMMGGAAFSVDIADHDDEYVVTADLPGFEKDDIDVSVSERTLTLKAEREMESDETDASYIRRERRSTTARRSIQLPEPVDEASASATYNNGVLSVTLPKLVVDDDESSHHIDIN